MNKLLIFILISFLLNNCSLNKNSKLWNEKEKTENEKSNERLADRSLDNNPASKGLKIKTQVGVGGKLPDAGKK